MRHPARKIKRKNTRSEPPPKTGSAEIRSYYGSYKMLGFMQEGAPHSRRLPPKTSGRRRPMLQKKPPVKPEHAESACLKEAIGSWKAALGQRRAAGVPEMDAVDGFPPRDMGMPAQDHIAGANLLSRPSLPPADSNRNDQSLPQRMGMPCSTGSWLRGGVCA